MKNLQFYVAIIILGIIILGIIILGSIFAPYLATHNPFEPNMAERLQSVSSIHYFGTDAIGRDMYSRILYGGRVSILLSLTAGVLSLSLGLFVGIICGFYGKKIDLICTAICNIFQGIPSVCFMIALVGILGPSIETLLFALILTSWAGFSRIVRAEVLQIKQEPFVEGLYCIGCSDFRLIIRHILPHLFNKLLVLFTIRIGKGILSIAGLSFLGLGVQPPMPDWSVMINDAMLYYRSAPHLIVIPGLCIFSLIYAINVVGDWLRDRLDVKFNEVRKC